MAIPQVTPLLLLSEFKEWASSSSYTGSDPAKRSALARASEYLTRLCGRRFDEYVDTKLYTARDQADGGHVRKQYWLHLGDDLRAVTSLHYNVDQFGDEDPIEIASGYQLLPQNSSNGVRAYNMIQLNPDGDISWRSGDVDPVNSIKVVGRWGYGGQWLDTLATVTADSGSSWTVSDGSKLEVGMVVKMGSEYRYVDAISTNTITGATAWNDSTTATHDSGTKIYRWQPLGTVQDLIIRLYQWRAAQVMAPLFGAAQVGEISFPVDTSSTPKDILDTAIRTGLMRKTMKAQAI